MQLAASIAVLGGCSAAADGDDLVAIGPLLRSFVETSSMIPIAADGTSGLGRGWSVGDATDGAASATIRGALAEATFMSFGDRDVQIVAEVRALQENSRLVVAVNGRTLDQRDLRTRWTEITIDVPAVLLRAGANALEMAVTVPPAGADEETGSATLRVRALRVSGTRGLDGWSAGDGVRAEDSALLLPVGAQLELALEVGAAATLGGQLEFRPGAGRSSAVGQLEWLLTFADGAQRSGATAVGERSATLELPLAPGGRVHVRLRSHGDDPGWVRWRRPRLKHGDPQRTTNARFNLPEGGLRAPAGRGPENAPNGSARQGPDRTGDDPSDLQSGARQSDVLVIVLDAARADAFGAYGATRATPAIDALAAAGIRYQNAMAPAPWTAPSVSSLMTGLLPETHGVTTWGVDLPRTPSFAQSFDAAGYRTLLWTQHPVYRDMRTLRRGFHDVAIEDDTRATVPAFEGLDAEDRPVMAFVHLLLPHAPYDPPPPFLGLFAGTAGARTDVSPTALHQFQRRFDPVAPSPRFVALARDRYDETVAWTDAQVGRVLTAWDRTRGLADSLVILTADHGEAFYEHGEFLHTRQVYQESLWIPLIVRRPATGAGDTGAGRGTVDMTPASLVDIAPTLVEEFDLPYDGDGFQGRNLFQPAPLSANPPLESSGHAVYASTRGGQLLRTGERAQLLQPRAALWAPPWKLVYDLQGGELELYDLASDRAERVDLASREPWRAAWMLQRLLGQRAHNEGLHLVLAGDSARRDLDPEVLERLRALGYIE